ncbi:MAG TPA: ThuA domain-containing protein [Candidatus Angelobacter sp.]|nr:ThuA domain-containing protein [Candidatus Angelobacter sp.]
MAANDPLLFVEASFNAKDPAFLAPFVSHVVRLLANRHEPAGVTKLVELLARQPAGADGLKQVALESLVANLKSDLIPAWSGDLQNAFKSLLASPKPGLPGAALPLIARWDKTGALASDLKPVIVQLAEKLQDASLPDDQRGQVAANLLGVRNLDTTIVPNTAGLLGSPASTDLQKRIIEALGSTGDAAAGGELIAAYTRVPGELHEALLGQLFKRADWSLALVRALADRKIDLLLLGPANLHRLRTHPDKTVASRANAVIDQLKGPEQKEKDKLLAQLKPEVEKPGDVGNGHKLFLANCAGCHTFKNEGRNLAPNLTGMGAHGPGELLVHIVDPNRLVEPNFVSVSIETKDDLSYDGIVERENSTEVLLRNATGDFTIRKDNIKSRRSTGRSLMPEGFEALGGEGLRDLLAYICADESKYRLIDLSGAFTANSARGIYSRTESLDETLKFRKFGLVKVDDVPFDVVAPARSATGNNLIVLKGGNGVAKTMPQKVEVKNIGIAASRLDFLGGVGGWAWPFGGDPGKNLPVAKITVRFADERSEEFVLKNGVEIADYNGDTDVPGSKAAPGLLAHGQVRWFTKSLARPGVIESLALESFDNAVAPTFVAVTAETAAAEGSSQGTSGAREHTVPAGGPRLAGASVLIVGGGSSHDFKKWFDTADSATLGSTGAPVRYTDKPDDILGALGGLDVLYLSNNQPMTNAALRRAIFDFANTGKGLLLVHPALWYNWPDWPEYNRALVGGGARSHDKYGEFEVHVDKPQHPIMNSVPDSFKISDELYHFEPDKAGTPIEVLATAKNLVTGRTYPSVWIVKHPRARIVCIALGHDGGAHDLDAYKTILRNALKWAAGK